VKSRLTEKIAGSVDLRFCQTTAPSLDPDGRAGAVFYSISNCKKGLDGH